MKKKKLKKKYEENFLVLYYQSVSVILFLASHSLMVRQKKIRVRSVIYYISRNTIKLKTSLIFGPPSTTVKAQSFSRSDTWSFSRSKIILDRFRMVFYHTCTNITRSWILTVNRNRVLMIFLLNKSLSIMWVEKKIQAVSYNSASTVR